MKSFVTLAQQTTAAGAKTVQAPAAAQTKATAQVPANGAAQEEPRSALDGFGSMMPMIIVMAVLIYFMWRGQKKEQKRRQEMIEGVKVGDKVVTIGGIYGEVVTVKEQTFIVKIADNTKVELMKSAVSSVPAGEEEKK